MMPVVMMPVVVMAPVVVVPPVAIVTDATRAVIGPDHPAATVRVIIGVIVVVRVVIGRAIEEAPVVMAKREPSVVKATAEDMSRSKPAAVEDRTAAKPAAMEYGAAGSEAATVKRRATAAVKHSGATVKASAAVEASASVEAATPTTAVETTSTAMATAAADFGRQRAGDGFRRRSNARIDQRQRLRALRDGRQRQHRGSRKTQTTDNAAPGARNPYHVRDLPEFRQRKSGPGNGLPPAR